MEFTSIIKRGGGFLRANFGKCLYNGKAELDVSVFDREKCPPGQYRLEVNLGVGKNSVITKKTITIDITVQ